MKSAEVKKRVVITGLGVVAPNGVGLPAFTNAIKKGVSGITYHQNLKDKGFSCCIGGVPTILEEKKLEYLTPLQLRGFNSTSILYGCMAGIDAWKDAGFSVKEHSELDYDSGIIFGTGTSGIEKLREAIYKIDDQNVALRKYFCCANNGKWNFSLFRRNSGTWKSSHNKFICLYYRNRSPIVRF
jgi:3-oxoacyl-(acyl-carrier-protein) synthase